MAALNRTSLGFEKRCMSRDRINTKWTKKSLINHRTKRINQKYTNMIPLIVKYSNTRMLFLLAVILTFEKQQMYFSCFC